MAFNPNQNITEVDLSSRLMKETTNHPLTLIFGVSALLTGSAASMFTTSGLFTTLAGASAVSTVACAGYVLNKTVFGRHREILKIIEKIRKGTCDERQKVSESVEKELNGFNEERALHQLQQLHGKFSAFQNVLNLQFDSDELTHKRYLTTAEQLYYGAVDNLRNLVVLRHSINAINSEHIQKQLEDTDLEEVTKQTLTERLGIYKKAHQDINQLLSINEQVMTKIDDVTSNLGAIQTREGLSSVRLDTAMNEILHLIQRTEKYDISQR